MRPLIQPTSLDHLTRQVQDIENRRGDQVAHHVPSGWGDLDQTLGGGLPRGLMQEWFGRQGPPLAIVGHLATRALRDEPAGWAVWIGREIWPYPHALVPPKEEAVGSHLFSAFSAASAVNSLRRSLWLDPATEDDRLWAMDQALRCPAVTAVIADGSGLNMAATRRLQLAAKASAALALLIRPDRERAELSAAALRWRVSPARSPTRHPRWNVELVRHKGHALNGPQRTWLLERNRAQGLVDLSAQLRDRPGAQKDGERRRSA